MATNAEVIAQRPTKAIEACEPVPKETPAKAGPVVKELSPKISFEKTLCDLGEVGRGKKNTCGFKFTNTDLWLTHDPLGSVDSKALRIRIRGVSSGRQRFS